MGNYRCTNVLRTRRGKYKFKNSHTHTRRELRAYALRLIHTDKQLSKGILRHKLIMNKYPTSLFGFLPVETRKHNVNIFGGDLRWLGRNFDELRG